MYGWFAFVLPILLLVDIGALVNTQIVVLRRSILNRLEFVNGKLHPDRLYTGWLLKGWEVIRKDQPWYCLSYCLQFQIITYFIDLQCMCLWVFLSYRLFGRIGNFIAKWIGDKQQARNIKRQNREHPAKKTVGQKATHSLVNKDTFQLMTYSKTIL